MAHHHHDGADAPGLAAPERLQVVPEKQTPAVGAGAARGQGTDESRDYRAHRAALTIEGESYAHAYLGRLHAGVAHPGELAVLLSFLTGEMLHGACRLIEKALEGRGHA